MSLRNGLISWWTLNEASGNRADSAGAHTMAQVGSITGDVGFGNVGKVSVWPGGTNYLLSGPIVSATPWTIAGWFNSSAVFRSLFSQNTAANFLQFIGYGNNVLSVSVDGSLVFNGATALSTGIWYHVAVTYDGTINAYLNGSSTPEISGASSAVYTNLNRAILGGRMASGVETLSLIGDLVGWGVWSRVLNSNEISQLYNGGNGIPFPLQSSPMMMGAQILTR